MKRGALIVVEGGDRSGKTTFCKRLVSSLESKDIPAKYINFPARDTEIGKLINKYLQSRDHHFSDETIHLLFSANRWEAVPKIKETLLSGTTLIVDRYAFSGVAFSAAKGLNLDWCKTPDIGLPKPDLIYFLQLSREAQAAREGFGTERYEVSEFQEKVDKVYENLVEPSWEMLDATRTTDELVSQITPSLLSLMDDVKDKEIGRLWEIPN